MTIKQLALVALILAVLFGATSLLLQPVTAQTEGPHSGRIDSALLERFEQVDASDYVIEMAETADLTPAFAIRDWTERGQFVVDALKATAEHSQRPVIEELKRQGLVYQSFFAGNEIYVYGGSRRSVDSLAALPEVDRIRMPVEIKIEPAFASFRPLGPAQTAAQEIEAVTAWGLTDTKAVDFWAENEIRGEGIVVANIDTGVQYNHPALLDSYKCAGNPGSNTCWLDPTGVCAPGAPCDNHGHGTHTMGTMVGSDDPALAYNVGMAPNAEWIACKGCAGTSCSDAALLACADWILAPGGNPANRPHVVNNSWGDTGGNDWYRLKVQSWVAAGIFPAFSAGNEYSCGSVGSPGDYPESFATASHTQARVISDFSSKGPGGFGDSPYTKPNLSAPGSSIRSTWPTNSWALDSGTSMASPHTAGAVALLWACSPNLRGDVAATFQALQENTDAAPAGSCGAPSSSGGNYTYGYGYLNVLAAGQLNCTTGSFSGTVTSQQTGAPLANAEVTASDGSGIVFRTSTEADGSYVLGVAAGTYTLTASKHGYLQAVQSNVVIQSQQNLTRNFVLQTAQALQLSGMVRDGSGLAWPLPARLTFSYGDFSTQVLTGSPGGTYSVNLYRQTPYTVHVEAVGLDYLPFDGTLTWNTSPAQRNFDLTVNPATCSAPGYLRQGGVSESFTNQTLPVGWQVVDHIGSGLGWRFDNPNPRNNDTGGSGGFAIVDSDFYGSGSSQDTSLVTPSLNFSQAPTVSLSFNTYLRTFSGGTNEVADVDVSNDGGNTWTNVWRRTADVSGGQQIIDLTSRAAGRSGVKVRFHYYNANWEWYWQVDDVVITPPAACIQASDFLYLPYLSR